MVYDRGKIKWASLMLPEHVDMLKELFAEEKPIKRPVLSEDQWEEMEYTIQQAISTHAAVKISYFERGYRYTVKGVIQKIDPVRKRIIIQEQHTYKEKNQSIADILAIEIIDAHEKP